MCSELDSICDPLAAMEEEARTMKTETRELEGREEALTKNIGMMTMKVKFNERKLEKKIEERREKKFLTEKRYLEGTEGIREKKEYLSGLLESSKFEVQILEQKIEKLNEVKMNLEKCDVELEELMTLTELLTLTDDIEAETDPKHDPDHAHNDDDNKSDDENTSEKSELTIYLDTDVIEIEKCLPELEKKGTQLALAASCRQDRLRRNLEILHSNAAEMVRKERDLKKIKENIDSMSKYKEEAVVTMENVEPLVTEPKMIEDKKEEEEILFRLDEKIQRKESEHRAALEKFNSLLETEQLKEERREKISKLKARLQELSGEK